jgi:phosphoribosylformylglycinamidine cyclo-ligase
MFNTFNMGVGMSLVVAAERVDAILENLPDAVILGEVAQSDEPVVIC